ncbi:MAG: hypothetical protein JRF47_10395 [Deltaproteobacteria bacterium]|jgi:hypothetical protein|nr:hypothetical protein [Deltaproteobacteria bacterium]
MTKKLLHFTIALLFAGMSLWGCSSDTEGKPEKGAIKQMTDQVAKDIVHHIRSPINKARAVKDQEEDRLSDVAEAYEDSSQIE